MKATSEIIQQKPKSNEIAIGENFVLMSNKKLGKGAFGEIYLGKNKKTNEEVAIKLEQANSTNPQLFYESKLYNHLKGGVGIPNIHFNGKQGNYNVLIIDLLGPSLEDLFNYCKQTFTLKTTILVIEQMLTRIEYMHQKYFIHRDIKPDNFLIGISKNKDLVYAIDFGLAKQYRHPSTGVHIAFKDKKSLTGTARYASINTHLGIEQSRRDDLEGLGYVMVYFLRGSLPWQGLKAKNMKEKYEKIKETKILTKLTDLCLDFPEEIQQFIYYTRELRFQDKPDYEYLRNLLKQIAEKNSIVNDSEFDWVIRHNEKKNNRDQHSKETIIKQLKDK